MNECKCQWSLGIFQGLTIRLTPKQLGKSFSILSLSGSGLKTHFEVGDKCD